MGGVSIHGRDEASQLLTTWKDIGAIGGILVMPRFKTDYGLPKGTDAKSKKINADLLSNSTI